jgi:hypothetical protein
MFIGRETELQKLDEMYESGSFERAVLIGRKAETDGFDNVRLITFDEMV